MIAKVVPRTDAFSNQAPACYSVLGISRSGGVLCSSSERSDRSLESRGWWLVQNHLDGALL